MTRPHEQAAILPHQVLVVSAGGQTLAHQRQGISGRGLISEGPFSSGGSHVKLGHRREGVGGVAVLGSFRKNGAKLAPAKATAAI